MTQQKFHSWHQLFWFAIILMVLYYVVDSAMDAYLFDEGTLAEQMFSPNTHELAIRILTGSFFFTFFLYAKHLYTKNHALQQNLLALSHELITANHECEAFTHSFSHNIRSNLTCIYAAEQLFTENHTEELSQDGKVLIEHIHDACEKMSAQIDEVLDMSVALRSNLDCQNISLNALVQEVVQEVILESNAMTVSIEIEKNLKLDCDPDLMRLAIRNLCLNAVLCSDDDKQADISIGADTRGGKRTFFIRRNDRDFDPAKMSNLFEFPSEIEIMNNETDTHSNLPSVRTIIERHGGRIWSESAAGVGAEFRFTL
jgi:light-regulated signal transduction histidine kinase (bacteriophytochrome)